jgi:hypothetical protein
MLKSLTKTCLSMVLLMNLSTWASAIPISPEIGSQATLVMDSHNVSGTVTIVDADTLRFDDFTYNGGASFVYFYLGTDETDAAFTAGLRVGTLLSGIVYDGTQDPFTVDLPLGVTVDGYYAVSVWCEKFKANFGSGTFQPVPEPAGIVLCAVGALGILVRRRI